MISVFKDSKKTVLFICFTLCFFLCSCAGGKTGNSGTAETFQDSSLTEEPIIDGTKEETAEESIIDETNEGIAPLDINSMFSYESFTGKELTVPYRKAEINTDTPGKPALVLCLHGHSASGNDNEKQMKKEVVQCSAQYFLKEKQAAIILAPQCPEEYKWRNKKILTCLRELIASYEDQIDASRIYVLGDSMGGGGAWALVDAYPQLFAAAMPAVSIPRENADSVCGTPICSVVGESDDVVTVDSVLPFIEELRSLGGNVRFETIPGANHQEACKSAFIPDNLAWVFSFKAQETGDESVLQDVVFVGDSRTVFMGTETINGVKGSEIIDDSQLFATYGGTLVDESAYENAKNAGQAKSKIVVFWYGINDVQGLLDRDDVEAFMIRYRAMIDSFTIENPDARVVILSILTTPAEEKGHYDKQEENIAAYNKGLEEYALEAGYEYLDITSLYRDDAFFPDLIHFDDEFYDRLKEFLIRYFQ